mgnify:CR=1 FL=1
MRPQAAPLRPGRSAPRYARPPAARQPEGVATPGEASACATRTHRALAANHSPATPAHPPLSGGRHSGLAAPNPAFFPAASGATHRQTPARRRRYAPPSHSSRTAQTPRRANAAPRPTAAAANARATFSRAGGKGGHVPILGGHRGETEIRHTIFPETDPTKKYTHFSPPAAPRFTARHGGPCRPAGAARLTPSAAGGIPPPLHFRGSFVGPSGRPPRSPVRVPQPHPRKPHGRPVCRVIRPRLPSEYSRVAGARAQSAEYRLCADSHFLAPTAAGGFSAPQYAGASAPPAYAGNAQARALRGKAATRPGRGKQGRANTRRPVHRTHPKVERGSCARLPEYRPHSGRLRRNTGRKRQPRTPSALCRRHTLRGKARGAPPRLPRNTAVHPPQVGTLAESGTRTMPGMAATGKWKSPRQNP